MSVESNEDGVIETDLMVEFKLRHRDDPVITLVKLHIPEDFHEEHTLEDLMDTAVSMILNEMDTVGTHRLVFEDSRFNKHIIIMDEIQAVSILSPDKLPGT